MDALFIGALVLFFALTWAFAAGCDTLKMKGK